MTKKFLSIIVLSIALITSFSFKAKAAEQAYDYYQGSDNWLSNNPYSSPWGGSFSGTPNPPLYGYRTFPDESKSSDWDNFYDIGRYWCWDNNPVVQYDNQRWHYPDRLYDCKPSGYNNWNPDNGGNYWYYDGIPNEYMACDYVFYQRPKPYFVCDGIGNYGYYSNGYYWVKVGTPFQVSNKFFDNEGEMSQGYSFLRVYNSSVDDRARHTFNSSNVNPYQSDGKVTFLSANDGDFDSNGCESIYNLEVNQDNLTLNVDSTAQNGQGTFWHYGNSDSEFYGSSRYIGWVNDFKIKSDGIAPGFDTVSDYKNGIVDSNVSTDIELDDNLNLTGSVDGLFDKGSGVKDVYALMYPTGRKDEAKRVELTENSDGEWILPSTNAYDLFQSSDINVDIHSVDNVGNDGLLTSKRFDLVTISASLTPDPAKEGQKITFNIKTTGFIKYIKIYFPTEITSLDTTTPVPLTNQIEEKAYNSDVINYIVPLKTPITLDPTGKSIRPDYPIQVTGTRADGKTVSCTLHLDVFNNVLDGLKTEIIDHGISIY